MEAAMKQAEKEKRLKHDELQAERQMRLRAEQEAKIAAEKLKEMEKKLA